MKELRFALVFLLLLGFGVPPPGSTEDVPETPYDESETLPCESTPVFAIAMPEPLAETPASKRRVPLLWLVAPLRPGSRHLVDCAGSFRSSFVSINDLDLSLRC
jgi:hypothetical protein